MIWTRSETLPLASADCVNCHGLGLRNGRLSETEPCNCVLRAIFRACYQRFVDCSEKEKSLTRVTLDGVGPQCRRFMWGRKDEEYLADFALLSKRTLDEAEFRLFRFHFVLGADWRMCCQRLGLDKGSFYHIVYRIQRKLGRVFRETLPYGLFPLDQYFHGAQYDPLDYPGTQSNLPLDAEDDPGEKPQLPANVVQFRPIKRRKAPPRVTQPKAA